MTSSTQQTRPYARRAGEQPIGVGEAAPERGRTYADRPEFGGAEVGQRSEGLLHDPERVARGLGWFSIGLGLAQIAAPRGMARMIGVEDGETSRDAMFAIGVREIASGIGLLTRPRPSGWVWTRVGGDVMDLTLLGSALKSGHANRNRMAAATAAVVGVTVLDLLIDVTEAITVNRSPEEVYRFWRNFENLPRFMEHLESVNSIDNLRSRWKAKAPAGTTVEWVAEIIDDQANRIIAWRSLPDADVPNSGMVRFALAPGNRGTEITVELHYEPPGGAIGAAIAKLFGQEPSQQVKSDLHRLKQVLETGEVMQSDASISPGPHPARPPAERIGLAPSLQGGI